MCPDRPEEQRRHLYWLTIAVLLLVTSSRPDGVLAATLAYPDIDRHWAEPHIQVLAEEGTTDGYRVYVFRQWIGWRWEVWFYPDEYMLLDEWTVLAAKVFDLSPAATSYTHRLNGGQEVSRWLTAAEQAGWVFGGRWKSSVSREEAVAFLVRALDLAAYAENLPATTVNNQLSRYRDGSQVSRANRNLVAAATLLGIVEGYPDGYFRPKRQLTRAEAATILARSALSRANAAPNPFYPDGDDIDDTTTFALHTLKNRNIKSWTLTVETYSRSLLWHTGSAKGWPSRPPAAITWDGTDNNGIPLPPGEYYYQLVVVDQRNQTFAGVRKPLVIDWRRLEGSLYPANLAPGDRIELSAVTWGDAHAVTADFIEWGESFRLTRGGTAGPSRQWQGGWQVPADAHPGNYHVRLTAEFPGTTRSVTLIFTVEHPVNLTAFLEPELVPAGGKLTVYAHTSPNVQRVTAEFEDGTALDLTTTDRHNWEAARLIPLETPEGSQAVLVVAHSEWGPRQTVLTFVVAGDAREGIGTVLTD